VKEIEGRDTHFLMRAARFKVFTLGGLALFWGAVGCGSEADTSGSAGAGGGAGTTGQAGGAGNGGGAAGSQGNVRLGPYAAATIAAAKAKNLLVDDLNARSVELLNMIGPSGAMLLYKGTDKAHFTKAGATKMAQLVAAELGRIGSPLAAYVK
jgi:hypothetical protein